MLSIFNRRRITNNMQIRSEIVSKCSNALKFLNKQQVRTYREVKFSADRANSNLLVIPIVWTLANSKIALTQVDFSWNSFKQPGTVILPKLTRSNFCYPPNHFSTILPSITWTMFYARIINKSEKKKKTVYRSPSASYAS